MKVKIIIEHCGEVFSGWQLQPDVLTVQGELERALQVYTDSLAKEHQLEPNGRIVVTGSGRTDAGVHALAQVASFDWPEQIPFEQNLLARALNGITVSELVVRDVEIADDKFDARLTPHIKCYQYRMLLRRERAGYYENRACCIPPGIDLRAMLTAARFFEGKHDFSAFRAADCSASTTIRWIKRSIINRINDDELVYTVIGNGFLKQMVRIMVGTLIDIGQGRLSGEIIPELLGGNGSRTDAGKTAPAEGLSLRWVRYS